MITHGTDIMAETRLYLQQALLELQRPVVLTRVMRQLGFKGSDRL